VERLASDIRTNATLDGHGRWSWTRGRRVLAVAASLLAMLLISDAGCVREQVLWV
jgi:hypothetical protein